MLETPKHLSLGTENIENLDLIPKTKHLCWLYENDEDRASVVSDFLTAAISRRKQCLLVVTEAVKDQILSVLSESEVNVERAQEKRQIITADPDEFLFNQGKLDVERYAMQLKEMTSAAKKDGWAGLSVVGDPSELLARASDQEWMALEFRADHACLSDACTILCLYDQRKASGNLLASLIKLHPVIGLGNAVAKNPFYVSQVTPTS